MSPAPTGAIPITYRADQRDSLTKRLARLIPAALLGVVVIVLIAGAIGASVAWRWAFHDLPELPETRDRKSVV